MTMRTTTATTRSRDSSGIASGRTPDCACAEVSTRGPALLRSSVARLSSWFLILSPKKRCLGATLMLRCQQVVKRVLFLTGEQALSRPAHFALHISRFLKMFSCKELGARNGVVFVRGVFDIDHSRTQGGYCADSRFLLVCDQSAVLIRVCHFLGGIRGGFGGKQGWKGQK